MTKSTTKKKKNSTFKKLKKKKKKEGWSTGNAFVTLPRPSLTHHGLASTLTANKTALFFRIKKKKEKKKKNMLTLGKHKDLFPEAISSWPSLTKSQWFDQRHVLFAKI